MIGDTLPENHIGFDYARYRSKIRSGDILLCSGTAVFSKLIQKATGSVWSHVAFILRLDAVDRIMILESVEDIGVRTVPLSSYLYDYNGTGEPYPGQICLARHSQFEEPKLPELSKFAIDLLGYPYDTEEITRIAMRIALSRLSLDKRDPVLPKIDREFICSEYVQLCFKSIGIDIPFNSRGFIAPADFARCPEISLVC